ncbi:hypothetical protein D8T25_19480 [Vibrio vulnificus]|nr:hypothetical protein D8T25_19480 [Vibrio vulnificus]
MEINNWLDFVLTTTFFFGVIFILIPQGVNYIYVGVVGVIKYKKYRYDKGTDIYRIGKNVFEIVGVGVFAIAFSIWFLFFDKGGHLFHYPAEVMRFFAGT